MPLSLLAAIGLFGLNLDFLRSRTPDIGRFQTDGWIYQVRHDRFTDQVSCTLTRRNMTFHQGAVVFQFGKSVNTADAVFRADDGPAIAVRDVQGDLAGRHIQLPDQSLTNPSGGRVMLPATRLAGVHEVSIRLTGDGRVWRFNIAGMEPALAAARSRGCDPDTFY